MNPPVAVGTECDHVLGLVSAAVGSAIEVMDFEVRVAALGDERRVLLAALADAVGEIVGDALGGGRAVYDRIGEWLVEKFVR